MSFDIRSIPQPRLGLVRWLSAPLRNSGMEVDQELRGSMFRRIEAVLTSAIITEAIVVLATKHHPTPEFIVWLAAETLLFAIRAPLAIYIMTSTRPKGRSAPLRSWTVDLFIIAGTVWSALLGYGCFISLTTQDPGLCVLVSLVAIGTAGAQSARNPSSPRLNGIQMSLIVVPLGLGAWFSTIPLVPLALFILPIHFVCMLCITLQLHDDYCGMIAARMEARRRAMHCGLTGLPNRLLFDDRLGSALERLRAGSGSLAILALDLDGFKSVNDAFGHPIGDLLLKEAANRLRGLIGADDTVARLGGDEFAILLCSGNLQQAEAGARSVIADLARPFGLTPQHTVTIGVSVGIAMARSDEACADVPSPALVLERADIALYAAKRSCRGTFSVYEEPKVAFGSPDDEAPLRPSAWSIMAEVGAV